MTPVINNGLTMTRSIKVATFLLALFSIERALAASISTPMPYFNRMYGRFAEYSPPDPEDLHGAVYDCGIYNYMVEEPGWWKSYHTRFLQGGNPRTVDAHYYGGDLEEDFELRLAFHSRSGELNFVKSKKTRNIVYTYRVSADARFMLVESVIKWKDWESYRKFMKPIEMPTVASQVYPDHMLLGYFVCERAIPF